MRETLHMDLSYVHIDELCHNVCGTHLRKHLHNVETSSNKCKVVYKEMDFLSRVKDKKLQSKYQEK